MSGSRPLGGFLGVLDRISRLRDEGVTVGASVPGERCETGFREDGHAEVEAFASKGGLTDERSLDKLFEESGF